MEKLSITLLNTVLNTFLKLLLISGYRNSLLARYSNYCKLFTVPDLSKRKRRKHQHQRQKPPQHQEREQGNQQEKQRQKRRDERTRQTPKLTIYSYYSTSDTNNKPKTKAQQGTEQKEHKNNPLSPLLFSSLSKSTRERSAQYNNSIGAQFTERRCYNSSKREVNEKTMSEANSDSLTSCEIGNYP